MCTYQVGYIQAAQVCSTKRCAGDRTTLRRAQLAEPIVHAAAFSTPHGAGIACLTYTGNLLVYSLPGLEPLLVFRCLPPLICFLSPLTRFAAAYTCVAPSADPGADSYQRVCLCTIFSFDHAPHSKCFSDWEGTLFEAHSCCRCWAALS